EKTLEAFFPADSKATKLTPGRFIAMLVLVGGLTVVSVTGIVRASQSKPVEAKSTQEETVGDQRNFNQDDPSDGPAQSTRPAVSGRPSSKSPRRSLKLTTPSMQPRAIRVRPSITPKPSVSESISPSVAPSSSSTPAPNPIASALLKVQQDLDGKVLTADQANLINGEINQISDFLKTLDGLSDADKVTAKTNKKAEVTTWAQQNNISYDYVAVI
ncbi:MAG: hypothetical protein WCI47_02675, partial [bacterium]